MCGDCCCSGHEWHPAHHRREHHMSFPPPLMDIEDEIKMLEEYKEALTKRLEKVNKRLEALKRQA